MATALRLTAVSRFIYPPGANDTAVPLFGARAFTLLQTKHGIHNHENLIFDELIADNKYQFVYCFTPSPIKGATGSNGGPIAIT